MKLNTNSNDISTINHMIEMSKSKLPNNIMWELEAKLKIQNLSGSVVKFLVNTLKKDKSMTDSVISRMTDITDANYRFHSYPDGKTEIDIKKRCKWIYMNNIIKDVNVNIILSKEYNIPIKSQKMGKKKMTRKIDRISFKKDFYSIDISCIDDKFNEIEIEFDSTTPNADSMLSVISFVFDIIEHAPRGPDYSSVVSEYNSLFGKQGRYIYFPMKKPRNIKRTDFINLSSDYVVFPKFDGMRYFLFIDEKSNQWLINQKGISAIKEKSYLSSCVLDGELISDNTFIAFDILVCTGTDIRDLSWFERHDTLTDLSVIDYGNKFWEICIPESDLHLVSDIGFEDGILDGIIFTPIHEPYHSKNSLKFKPSDKLTIDFVMSIKPDEHTSAYKMELMSSGNECLIPFKGTDDYPLDDIIIISQDNIEKYKLMNNCIVEFMWDGLIFIPLKVRDDKVSPNYIDIAKDVWNDINDPISLDEIEDNL